jgi:hypothetical protein
MKSAKDECEELMSAVLPRAERQLAERGAFAPFGAVMAASGEITQVEGSPVSAVQSALRERAAGNELRAAALVYDLRVLPPGSAEEADAVAIQLDHASGYCVVVTFPYRYTSSGGLVVDEPFANELDNATFSS